MLLDYEELVKKYNMNVTGVIHIGGHHGSEYDLYKKYDSIKHILFFEPDLDSYKILCDKVKGDDKVVTVNRALGPFRGKTTFYRSKDNLGQSNSLMKPDLHARQYPHIVFNEEIEISFDHLDRYEPNKKFNLINIDVQGFELNVFIGAKKTLKNIDYIIAEVNRDELYENCARVEELDAYLGLYGFERKETSWDGMSWGDAFYVKKS
jgi:FkbM family methyltransferase|tara:strand:+ start:149 stop:769 length:621 start_codon:yes stop_codon:yes gene_type:complete